MKTTEGILMGLLDDMTVPTAQRKCRVFEIAESLEESDRKIFLDAAANKKWSTRLLVDSLRDRGIVIGRDSIDRHRRETCPCWKI